jgi:hypothetical protein
MNSVTIKITDESSIISTVLSISQTFDIPLIEGNRKEYEIIVPEKNDRIEYSLIDKAKTNGQRIAIRPVRLQMLLEMENKLKLLTNVKKQTLENLHIRDKLNPESVRERVGRYIEKHRDEINARRREKRKLENLDKKGISKQPTSNTVIIKRITNPIEICKKETAAASASHASPAAFLESSTLAFN